MTELSEQFKKKNEEIKSDNLEISVDKNIASLLLSIDSRIKNNSDKFIKRLSNVFKSDNIEYALSDLVEIVDLESNQLKTRINEVIEKGKDEVKENLTNVNDEEKTDESFEKMKEETKTEVNESVLIELKAKLKDKYTLTSEDGFDRFDNEISIYNSNLYNDIEDQIEIRRMTLKNSINEVTAKVKELDAKVMAIK